MLIRKALFSGSAAIAFGVFSAGATLGQTFPDRPIELIVPFAPGGGSDISARVFASCLRDVLPQRVVVRNITGGAGAVAEDTIVRERPTGYRLLWQHQSMHALSARGIVAHAPDDFEVIAQVAFGPWGLFTNTDVPFSDLEGMKAYVTENPGDLRIGAAQGGLSHFASLLLMEALEIDIADTRIIGVVGSMGRLVAILQGNLDGGTIDVASAKPYVEAGQMKSIAILADEPVAEMADAATARSQGFDISYGVNIITWAPKDTPDDVLTVLRDAWEVAATDETCVQELEDKGLQAMYRDHEAVVAYNIAEMETYRNLIDRYEVD